MEKNVFFDLENLIKKLKSVSNELNVLISDSTLNSDEKKFVNNQVNLLKKDFLRLNTSLFDKIKKLNIVQSQNIEKESPKISSLKRLDVSKKSNPLKSFSQNSFNFESELFSIKRVKKKKEKEKLINPKVDLSKNFYSLFSNKLFSKFSRKIVEKGFFRNLNKDLSNAGIKPVAINYLSICFFSSIIVLFLSTFFSFFYLFFSFSFSSPFISLYSGDFILRILQIFWIIFIFPLTTFFFMIFYPKLESKSRASLIDQEIPFVTINLAAISGSLLEPTKIFEILILNKEYPNVEKEFVKLINEVNIFGHDLVTSLYNASRRSPSKKLSDLFNGIAVTLTSGGDLSTFFSKRAETLLFDYRLEREKNTKLSETFMDIYISVVIAAPLIFMLLLMMMKISGFGVALSSSAISLITVSVVSVINLVFLLFLHLKQPSQ